MVDETVYGRVTPERFDEIVELRCRRQTIKVLRSADTSAPLARRRRGRGRDRGRSEETRRAGRDRAQRLARAAIGSSRSSRSTSAGAASRMVRSARRTSRVYSPRISSRAASTRSRSVPPRRSTTSLKQTRLTFARVGVIDPLSLDDYRAHGGYRGLCERSEDDGEEIVAAVTDSGLRGRGGAAFPTGIKWKTVLGAPADQKYVVCNADEGDSGTFSDRMIMESDPFVLIEGMTIAGLAVGATRGFVYIRCEYPQAIATMRAAIERATAAGFLGERIQGGERGLPARGSARPRAPTSAAKRRRCSRVSKASAAWSAIGRRCPRSRASSASRRRSTT